MPYDLTREAYTRQLWAFEGFTSYYDDLALVRSDLIDAERYLELLGRTLTTVRRAPGGLRRASPTRASTPGSSSTVRTRTRRMPWSAITPKARSWIALDLVLRRDGNATLDDLMRALWQR